MKALVLHGPNDLRFEELPKPENLQKGQVLVKMAYAPINPSDLAFLTGNYGIKKEYPVVPGLEGSGTVVSSGGGLYANYLKGKNVACVAGNQHGTWANICWLTPPAVWYWAGLCLWSKGRWPL